MQRGNSPPSKEVIIATVSVSIPDALLPRVKTAFDADYPRLPGETDAQLFKRIVAQFVKSVVVGYETRVAEAEARVVANEDIAIT